jgi:hypothetical protein
MNRSHRHAESGNVIFYIFLAVALFGALSFAVSQSGRDSGDSAVLQQNRLRATEIIDYGDTVARGVGMIRLRGTTLATLSFSSAGTTENDVFGIDGGGINYRVPSSEVTTTGTENYQILTGNAVQGVGTTCTAPSCAELLLVLGKVKPAICTAIDQLAGINPPDFTPPVDSAIDLAHPYTGTMAYGAKIGDEPSSIALNAQMYGCLQNDTDHAYYYYRVLWQQ